MKLMPSDPLVAPRAPRSGRVLSVGAIASALVFAALAGCGEGEPTQVPIAAVPLGEAGGQCVDVFQQTFADAEAKLCLYFEGASCVLVADLLTAQTQGCMGEGNCSLEQASWMKYCPEGSPAYDLETEAGQSVPAQVYIVAEGMAGERPSFCTFAPPVEACDGSTDPQQTGNRCLARLELNYLVDELDGTLSPDPSQAPLLTYSGFVQEEMGLWNSTDPVCPSIDTGSCPPESASCTSVDLELLLQGSSTGQVRTVPRGDACVQPRCLTSYPRGRMVSVSATADAGAVVTSFTAALGAEEGCNEIFVETTTTATCGVTLTGSGQVTVKFGYELTVGVNGVGQVTGTPGGVDGDGIMCAGNQTCREVYEDNVMVTLTANQTEGDWQFSQWMGGPCDGQSGATCTLQMDQAQSVSALFGYALSIDVQGDGSVTAQPPGVSCTGQDSPCVVTYGSGDAVTLTVSPSARSVFLGWGGDCAAEGVNTTCALTMDQERSVVARFAYEVESRVEGGGTVTRTPVGEACSVLSSNLCGAYETGSSVAFDTAATTDWVFLDWSGCSAAPGVGRCSVTVNQASTIRARFGRQLDLTLAGAGAVDMPAPVHGTCSTSNSAACTGAYVDGTALTLTGRPDAGWALEADSWTGCTPVAGNPAQCTVSMGGPRQVSVVFGRQLDVSTTGNGQVTSVPAGIDCGADCTEVFGDGAGVQLTAQPDTGWAFESWSGCTPDAGNPAQCTVTMSGAQTVTANFGRALQVAVVGGGLVQSTPAGIACSDTGGDCSQAYAASTNVTLDATASAGWAFLGWAGCTPNGAIPTRCSTTLSASRSVTATFGRQMTVSTTGMGSVVVVGPASGISCPGDCDEVFADGSQVTLRGNPAGGWALVGFSGCDSVNNNECTVTMNQARSVAATFGRNMTVSVTGGGQVISNPAGINCSSGAGDCAEAYVSGTAVTLDATPTAGWSFLSWAGCTPVSGVPTRCSTTMNAARNVTATFGRELVVATSGNGTVTSAPAGINCGADCNEVYANGTSVVLTAAAGGGAQFGSWSGCPAPAGNVCTVSMDAARSITASFGTGVTVVIADGLGSVQSTPPGISCPGDCNEVYSGTPNVTLNATPNAGWVVRDWAGCTQNGSNPNQCTLTASGVGQTVTVRFGRQINVNVTGAGVVTSAPPGINCGTDCDEVYANNTPVTLTATPNGGWSFLSWTGCAPVGGTPEQCTTTMSAVRNVSATFGRQLNVTVNGGGVTSSNPVGVNCGTGCEVHLNGTQVIITATPNAGWALLGWAGCTPQANPLQCAVTMTAQRNVTVNFGRQMDVTISGQGAVTSNPAGINCGADCQEVFTDGQNVTLTAAPTAGHALSSWSGCTPVGGNPNQCTTAMTAARAVNAVFQPTLTVNAPSAGAGETVTSNPAGINCVGPSCTDTAAFAVATAVRLTATPGVNRVVSWSGCTVVTGNENACDVTVNAPTTVTPTFDDTFPLTITMTSTTGTGTINLSLTSREGTNSCNADCTVRYPNGNFVTLTPVPDVGSTFGGFSGICTGASCTVNMNQARAVGAAFVP